MGCSRFQAEEIAQEVLLRFLRWRREGVKINDLRGWAFRVAHNLWIDSRREFRRFWPIDAQDGGRSAPARVDPAPDPERRMLQRERFRQLENEVARLPELQQECLRLKRQGYRYREIASSLGISPAAAAECVRQAVRTLRKRSRK
jgi:RNA polymerase sigma-70 factor (ECF subfamily)